MRNILKPAPRLIAVFILTMVISGGILTYLSINSISNFRELTEKKVSEEQIALAQNVSVTFQTFLKDLSLSLNPEIQHEAGGYLHHPFRVDQEGGFLKPWFLEESILTEGPSPESAYGINLQLAQQSEFQDKSFSKAAKLYRESLNYASDASDSARSFNALGRVHMKSQNLSEAFRSYVLISSDYSSLLDNSGFPYVYYAVLNLMEINLQESGLEIIPTINRFLLGLIKGYIPMNNSTSEILMEISSWTVQCKNLEEAQLSEIETSLRKITSYLDFIAHFGQSIKEACRDLSNREGGLYLNSFRAIHNPIVDPGLLVLLDTSTSDLYGYSLDIDTLWLSFIKDWVPLPSEFEYNLELIRLEIPESRNQAELTYMPAFSPYFPSSSILISLKDVNMIDIFVKRRSWTYGIALFLLLGAMLLGVVLIIRDLNRERHLAHLRSDFVSNVSHELKTPLTSIHVFAESILLNRVKSLGDQKEYLKIILKETERLKRMINNILDFSKREKGKIQYQSRPVDVTALLREAQDDLSYWMEEMNFKVETELEEGVLCSGDQEALKQVVINLLDNAIKYSDKVKEIGLRLNKEEKIIRIEVADKGVGIPEDHLKHIFDKYYRVNHTQLIGVGGTGLGLTVVKEIVEAHEGRIRVHSELGKGSTFTIELNSL